VLRFLAYISIIPALLLYAMNQKGSHLGDKIADLEYFPVMDTGCGACVDESTEEKIVEDGMLDRVVESMGGANSQSGTVLVAMSGGVDSSVIPAILTKLGYKCVGVHMQFWVDDKFNPEDSTEFDKFPENKCCSLESLEHAREIAHKYGMPFYVLNTRDVFKENIVDDFVERFAAGVTPNPCIECNRSVKFGFLIQKMHELGCEYLATGHYVKVDTKDGIARLRMATDKLKDQSYFLYTVTEDKLKHCMFPLAELTKNEVRQIAKEEGLLKVSEKKDSQGICFFPEKSHVPFLKRHMEPEITGANTPGPMRTKDGEDKGEHKGLAFYTIGQRQGLDIGGPGGPWYVIGKDPENNALIVGANEDLFSQDVHAVKLSFVPNALPKELLTDEGMPILARLRHRFTPDDAVLKIDNLEDYDPENPQKSFSKLTATITYDQPQRAVTPGQSIVFYKADEVIGGGIIV